MTEKNNSQQILFDEKRIETVPELQDGNQGEKMPRDEANDFQPLISDLLMVGGDLGCRTLPRIDREICAAIQAGIDISGSTDVSIGGELLIELTLSVTGYDEVQISPGGFGFSVGPDDVEGWCWDQKVDLPGPLPGGQVEICGELRLYTRGSGIPEIQFGIGVSSLDVCVDPCGPIDCEVCGTIVSVGVEFKTPWVGVSDIPNVSTLPW